MSKNTSITTTVSEIARAMGISRAAAYQLTHSAGFPALRAGTRIIIPRDAFLRWLDAQANEPISQLCEIFIDPLDSVFDSCGAKTGILPIMRLTLLRARVKMTSESPPKAPAKMKSSPISLSDAGGFFSSKQSIAAFANLPQI